MASQETTIRHLLQRYQRGECSKHELEQLNQLLSKESDTDFEKALATELTNQEFADTSSDEKFEKLYASIAQQIRIPQTSRQRRLPAWLPYVAAASIIAALAVAIHINNTPDKPSASRSSLAAGGDIAPGGNRATLTLAGGQVVTLDEKKNRIIMGERLMYKDGEPIGNAPQTDESITTASPEAAWLELATPRGGTYEIVLPDGTQVWLNAESALRYPDRFTENERVVFLTGEAFFAVAKNEQLPFKVISDGQEVEVLGTEFNVSAYPTTDRSATTKTTVVEGRVKVTDRNNTAQHAQAYLQAGQQSIHSQQEGIRVRKVAVAPVVSWKNGLFYFDETPIEDALSQLARWYDIAIRYEGTMPKSHFYGQISRSMSLKQVLGILEESGVRFAIKKEKDRNTLTVLSR